MTTIFVASCHRYADCWPAMAESLRRYWPSRPWRTVLVTDARDPKAPELNVFRDRFTLDRDLGWTRNLESAIVSGLYEPPYALLQEDFLLNRDVDESVIVEAAILMERDPSIGCFRLYPCPGPQDEACVGSLCDIVPYGEVHVGEPYRVSCQAALWSRAFLLSALSVGSSRGATPQDFEFGSLETSHREPCRVLSVLRAAPRYPVSYLCTSIVNGRWSRDAVRMIREWGLDPGTRAVQES